MGDWLAPFLAVALPRLRDFIAAGGVAVVAALAVAGIGIAWGVALAATAERQRRDANARAVLEPIGDANAGSIALARYAGNGRTEPEPEPERDAFLDAFARAVSERDCAGDGCVAVCIGPGSPGCRLDRAGAAHAADGRGHRGELV